MKNLLIEFYIFFKRILVVKAHNKSLSKYGYVVHENFLSSQECDSLVSDFDSLMIDEKIQIWSDELGSDKRIFGINNLSKNFENLYENKYIQNCCKKYLNKKNIVGFGMCGKIVYRPGNLGSGQGWHRDTPHRHQFKAIVYLTDVNEQNGPFQYIQGSHRTINVLLASFAKILPLGSYRYHDAQINKYLFKFSKEQPLITFTARKGTLLLVDTKGIHRGHPLEKDYRYAYFSYFWESKIPSHIYSLVNEKSIKQ